MLLDFAEDVLETFGDDGGLVEVKLGNGTTASFRVAGMFVVALSKLGVESSGRKPPLLAVVLVNLAPDDAGGLGTGVTVLVLDLLTVLETRPSVVAGRRRWPSPESGALPLDRGRPSGISKRQKRPKPVTLR